MGKGRKLDYHSALSDPLPINDAIDYYEHGGSVVFRHNIAKGPHPQHYRAEAVYSEPSWRQGYIKFMRRAGVKIADSYTAYNEYLAAIHEFIVGLNRPTYILMGKHMLKRLPPHEVIPIKLHGYEALLGLWNVSTNGTPLETHEDALHYVAQRYNLVADFCCGYGNLARAMLAHGKRFICSDVNGKCVYYVARELMGYG